MHAHTYPKVFDCDVALALRELRAVFVKQQSEVRKLPPHTSNDPPSDYSALKRLARSKHRQ